MHQDHKTISELQGPGVGIPVGSHPYKSSVFSGHA